MGSYLSLGIFLACYAGFVLFPRWRSWCACAGAILLVLLGVMSPGQAFRSINWNVIMVFMGVMIIAELLILSRLPSYLAEHIVNRAKRASWAMISLCGLTSFLSIFLENVATVLIVAPVALSIADRLKIRPTKLLIALALCSNLQGTGTLIGDSPSIILAGYAKLTFNDFFFFAGRPSIFFAVQAGALASLVILYFFFRKFVRPEKRIEVEGVRSWVPVGLLGGLVFSLALASFWKTDFPYKNGLICITFGFAGLLVYRLRWKRNWGGRARDFIKGLDWDTGLFLLGVFVLVGGLSSTGWIDKITQLVEKASGGNLLRAYITIIGLSVAFSAFIDNIPYVMIMLPVVDKVAHDIHGPPVLLMFGLLIGACLGGNISPFGASCNVVAVGMLRSRGIIVSVREFVKMGLPFTLSAVTAGSLFLWLVWVGASLSYSPVGMEKVTVRELHSLTLNPEEEKELRHIIDSLKETVSHLVEEIIDTFEGEDARQDTEKRGTKDYP